MVEPELQGVLLEIQVLGSCLQGLIIAKVTWNPPWQFAFWENAYIGFWRKNMHGWGAGLKRKNRIRWFG